MLPGFLLMLCLSGLYFEANLGEELSILFYGLGAAVVALLGRALVRLGSSFITDIPLALIAIAAFVLTLFADTSFVLVLLGAGILYELRTGAFLGRSNNAMSISPLLVGAVLAGGVTIGLVGTIFSKG